MIKPNIIPYIQKEFDELICISQGIKPHSKDKINSTPLLEEWSRNKERFYEAFGRTLIYDTGELIECDISVEEKKDLLEEFLDEIEDEAKETEDLELKSSLEKLINFIEDVGFSEFFKNKAGWDYREHGVKCGEKVVKAFKNFFSPKYQNEIIYWQQKASELIQKSKITGYLKFSIHPLDFLTISENNHNWSSCHSLRGDYAGGNLEYLTDKITFIAYLASTSANTEKIAHLDNFQWNSKKWRMLVYVSENQNLVFLGREYPFSNSRLLHLTQQFVTNRILNDCDVCDLKWKHSFDRLSQSCGPKYEDHIMPSFICGDTILQVRDLIEELNPLYYNDLLYSSFYLPIVRFGDNFNKDEDYLEMGGKPICAFCGETIVNRTEMLLCDNCTFTHSYKLPEGFIRCDHCNKVCEEEDSYWINSENLLLCPSCNEEYELEQERNGD